MYDSDPIQKIQPTQEPKQFQLKHFYKNKFVLLTILIIILILSNAGFFVLGKNSSQQSQPQDNQLVQEYKPQITQQLQPTTFNMHSAAYIPLGGMNTPTPYISDKLLQKVTISSWQTYKNHFAQVTFDYPALWSKSGNGTELINFYPPDKGSLHAILPIIFFTTTKDYQQSDPSRIILQDNFPISALSKNEKATLYLSAGYDIYIQFKHNNSDYLFYIDKNSIQLYNFELASVVDIMKHMAQSLKFTNEPYSCSDPALSPLAAFPDSFTLRNNHDSDGADKVNAIDPYSYPSTNSNPTNRELNTDSNRIFLVNYIKSGPEFENFQLINNVMPIEGSSPLHLNDDTTTEITHINCVDTQEDGPGEPQIYTVSHDNTDPFAIHLFGYKDNPKKLWDVSRWNVDLLKQRRNEVYMLMGTTWQKYIASGYYVSLVQGYGAN